MDSESRLCQNLDTTPDLLSIKQIALFNKDSSAKLFLDKVFPYYSKALVVSMEGGYPYNSELYSYAMRALKTNESLILFIFNIDSVVNLNVKTERILCFDDLILSDFRSHRAYSEEAILLSVDRLAKMMSSFSSQWESLQRVNNVTTGYCGWKYYLKPYLTDWRAGLLFDVSDAESSFSVKSINSEVGQRLWTDIGCCFDRNYSFLKKILEKNRIQLEENIQNTYYGLFFEGHLIGVVHFVSFNKKWLGCGGIFIDQKFRGRDLGWRLLQHILLKEFRSIELLLGYVPERYIRWAEKRGFFSFLGKSEKNNDVGMILSIKGKLLRLPFEVGESLYEGYNNKPLDR